MTRATWKPLLAGAVAGLVAIAATIVGAPLAHADEPIRSQQWYLDSWKIEEAWKISRGEGVTIALIDGGVNDAHPDLAGQVIETPLGTGYGDGHGTRMASSIVGTGRGVGGQGAYGVAPKAKIISYNAGLGDSEFMDPFEVAPAIRAAADSSAKIINLAFRNGGNPVENEAVAYAVSRGKLVIAAGGNVREFNPQVVYPASVPGVLGVGGYDRNGMAWTKTLAGNWISLAAPSVDIITACTGATGYCKSSGTSDAAALTSGVAALLWAKYPHYTANQIIRVLIDSANKPNVPVPNEYLGWGNVSPRNALNWTGDPGPPDVNPLIGKRGDMPTPSPSSSSAAATMSPSPSPAATAAPSPQPSISAVAAPPNDGGESDSGMLLVGIIVAGVAVLGGGLVLFFRSRANRPGPPTGGPPPYANFQQN